MDYQLLTPGIPVSKDCTPVEWVFANRGIEPQDIDHYLHTSRADIIDPNYVQNIRLGVEMLLTHLKAKDKIFIQVDSDVDGFTSAAALINYLNMLFPGYTQQNISYRLHDGKQHGIVLDTIPEDVKLVICPDSSSNQYQEHQILKERGVDVLVIDHHEAEKISEYACIINNQLCDYPTKSLSGVGMVYKVCQYIDQLLGQEYSDNILDLVAVGIVSDMMDLRDFETAELVRLGLNRLRNPFISSFVKAQEFSIRGEVTPFKVSFYIAPYINATIRVGSSDEKMLLFESMLDFRAYEQIPSTKRGCKGQLETRVEQACRSCKNIKNRQDKARDTSLEIIEGIIEEEKLLEHPIIIVQLEEPVDKNLTGLIANQIMGRYMRPVLILNKIEHFDENTGLNYISWEGSGRNSSYSRLENLREFLNDSGFVDYAQGHAAAFGIGIKESYMQAFKDYIDKELKDFDFSSCYRVDFIWDYNEVGNHRQIEMDLASLNNIWGQGIAQPYIAIENITVTANNIKLMSPDKNPTLKITLPDGTDLIKFRSSQEEYDSLYSDSGCVAINIVGTCELNVWNGIANPQIHIEDYEIVSKSAYYF